MISATKLANKTKKNVVAESETKIDVTKMYLVSRNVQNCTIDKTHQNWKEKREKLAIEFTVKPAGIRRTFHFTFSVVGGILSRIEFPHGKGFSSLAQSRLRFPQFAGCLVTAFNVLLRIHWQQNFLVGKLASRSRTSRKAQKNRRSIFTLYSPSTSEASRPSHRTIYLRLRNKNVWHLHRI